MGGGRNQYEMRNCVWIPGRMSHRYHSAITRTYADDRLQSQMESESLHVFDILVEKVALRISSCRSPMSAVVEIDDLQSICEGRPASFVRGVIRARATVNK